MKIHFKKTRGNILFLILLAVVLFAALSYAVTASLRGGGKDAKSESVTAQASAILGFFSQIDGALMRMQLTGGIKAENISFEYEKKMFGGASGTSPTNPNCTSDACRIFKLDGGAAIAQTFEKYAYSAPYQWTSSNTMPGYYDLYVVQWPSAGTSANDIVLQLNAMPQPLCNEINRQLDIVAVPQETGTPLGASLVANWDGTGYSFTNNADQLIGKTTAGVFYRGTSSSPDSRCHIFHVLFAR